MSKFLNWDKFKISLGSWSESFKPFFDKEGFDPIYTHLRERGDLGYKVLPDSKDTFRVFQEVDKSNLKAIFWLQD